MMGFCPVCKSKYREGIEVCPTDGALLVDELPDDNAPPQEKDEVGISILISDSPDKLEEMQEMLAASGINSEISVTTEGESEFSLLVKIGHVGRAKSLLERYIRETFPEDLEEGLAAQVAPLSRRKRIVLGIVALAVPAHFLAVLGLQAYVFSVIRQTGQMPDLSAAVILAFAVPSLFLTAGVIYYLYQIWVSAETPADKKWVWILICLLVPQLSLPFHYYYHWWKPLRIPS